MTDRRSSFRKVAEAVVLHVLRAALAAKLDAKAQRRALRASFAELLKKNVVSAGKSPRACWYAAVRAVTGAGVLALTDPRQQSLPLAVGIRRARSRRKDPARAR